MPTCSQITDALNTLASATTNPNILADVSGQTAVLSNIGTAPTIVSLSAGGPAVLSAPSSPSLDGVPFRIYIAGQVHIPSINGPNFIPLVYQGNSSTIASNALLLQVTGHLALNGSDGNFFITLECIWSAASGRLGGISSGFNMSQGTHNNQFTTATVATQADLQFVVAGLFTDSEPLNSVTITQFKMQLI